MILKDPKIAFRAIFHQSVDDFFADLRLDISKLLGQTFLGDSFTKSQEVFPELFFLQECVLSSVSVENSGYVFWFESAFQIYPKSGDRYKLPAGVQIKFSLIRTSSDRKTSGQLEWWDVTYVPPQARCRVGVLIHSWWVFHWYPRPTIRHLHMDEIVLTSFQLPLALVFFILSLMKWTWWTKYCTGKYITVFQWQKCLSQEISR